jgi:hypothetical protein
MACACMQSTSNRYSTSLQCDSDSYVSVVTMTHPPTLVSPCLMRPASCGKKAAIDCFHELPYKTLIGHYEGVSPPQRVLIT